LNEQTFVKPNVYVIAGPNGAGKTTFAREFLPLYAQCKNFINADLIAEGVSPFSPESAAIRAGRLMLIEIRRFGQMGIDFGFETTLSGRTLLKTVIQLRNWGYQIHFFYLWVSSVELAVDRVKVRVEQGGHDVPEAIVRRRFERSIRNFLVTYRKLCDSWTFFDNSGETPRILASEAEDKLSIIVADKYEDLIGHYGGK
jgi:predicted ABC-type ATPase